MLIAKPNGLVIPKVVRVGSKWVECIQFDSFTRHLTNIHIFVAHTRDSSNALFKP